MSQLIFRLGVIFSILFLSNCKSLEKEDGLVKEVPGDGLLGAKLMALEHALNNISDEDKTFGDSEYFAYGISDTDSIHNKAIIKILANRKPPIVDAEKFYTRSSNSQWMSGRPVLKWITEATKDPNHPLRVNVLVGWIHSQIINQFYTYKLEYDGVIWTILQIERLDLSSAP